MKITLSGLDTLRERINQAVLAELGRMDALMPIVDPTAYRGIMRNMPGHRDQVNAFLAFRSALERLVETKDGQG